MSVNFILLMGFLYGLARKCFIKADKKIKLEIQQKRWELQHLKLKHKLHGTYLLWEEGGSKDREFISKPLWVRSSFLILHLLYFPENRMRNEIYSTGSSVSYWFLEWLCPFQPHILYTIHLATGIPTEAIFSKDIIAHWHRNYRNNCHTAETFPFSCPLGQTVLPSIPQPSAAECCLGLNTLLTKVKTFYFPTMKSRCKMASHKKWEVPINLGCQVNVV